MLTLHIEAATLIELRQRVMFLLDTTLAAPAPVPMREEVSAANLGYQNREFEYRAADAPETPGPADVPVKKYGHSPAEPALRAIADFNAAEPKRRGRPPGRRRQTDPVPPAGADEAPMAASVPAAQPEVANTGSASDGSPLSAAALTPEPHRPPGQSPVPASEPTLEDVRAAGQKLVDKLGTGPGTKKVLEIIQRETGETRMSAAHAKGRGAKLVAAFEAEVA